jgi:hypothetical protein
VLRISSIYLLMIASYFLVLVVHVFNTRWLFYYLILKCFREFLIEVAVSWFFT